MNSQLATQQSIFIKPNTRSKATKIASYRLCHILAMYKKSFQDREMFKKTFVEAANSLFGNFKNKDEIMSAIKDLIVEKYGDKAI